MRKQNLSAGIIFVIIGMLLLLINFDIIDWSLFLVLGDLWPLILIVIGINIIFRNRHYVKIITWIVLLIIMISYSYFYDDIFYKDSYDYSYDYSYDKNYKTSKESNIIVDNNDKTKTGRLHLALGAGDIDINSTDENLVNANIPKDITRYSTDFSNDERNVNVSFRNKNLTWNSFDIRNHKKFNYSFDLNDQITWDIDVNIGAIEGTFNLSNLDLENLDVDMGAGDLEIVFGDKSDHIDFELNAAASDIELNIPKEIGVKVDIDSIVTNTNLKALGWIKDNGYYYSPNYDDADKKIEIEVNMAAGNLRVVER